MKTWQVSVYALIGEDEEAAFEPTHGVSVEKRIEELLEGNIPGLHVAGVDMEEEEQSEPEPPLPPGVTVHTLSDGSKVYHSPELYAYEPHVVASDTGARFYLTHSGRWGITGRFTGRLDQVEAAMAHPNTTEIDNDAEMDDD